MSINMSKARDALQIYGSVIYGALVTAADVAKVAGRPVPGPVEVPQFLLEL